MPRVTRPGNIDHIFANNRVWVDKMVTHDPEYFSRWADAQKPRLLWIGCSDSRVVAEAAAGLEAGEMFVHRNIGNILSHSDGNGMSVLEYSVKVLGVKDILVCGHTQCGAVQAALKMPLSSCAALLTNCWISQIRDVRNQNEKELLSLPPEQQATRLTELNVIRQVFNVCTSPVVQHEWEAGKEVHVHGLVYNVRAGTLRRLLGPVSDSTQIPLKPETAPPLGGGPDSEKVSHTMQRAAAALDDASKDEAQVRALQRFASGGSGAPLQQLLRLTETCSTRNSGNGDSAHPKRGRSEAGALVEAGAHGVDSAHPKRGNGYSAHPKRCRSEPGAHGVVQQERGAALGTMQRVRSSIAGSNLDFVKSHVAFEYTARVGK